MKEVEAVGGIYCIHLFPIMIVGVILTISFGIIILKSKRANRILSGAAAGSLIVAAAPAVLYFFGGCSQ